MYPCVIAQELSFTMARRISSWRSLRRAEIGGGENRGGYFLFHFLLELMVDACANRHQVLSHEATYQVKQLGDKNDLIQRKRKGA
jgi:hypothetical protein